MPEFRQPVSSGVGARASVVNRTRRIVREQAMELQEQRRRSRSLLAPLIICSALLFALCYALWSIADGYDMTPNGIPDASYQVLVFMLLSLPLTIIVLGLIWLQRRSRNGEQMP